MHALAVDQPALTPQQNVDAQIAEARAVKSKLSDTHAQRCLILGQAAPIPGRAPQQHQPARLLHTRPEVLADPVRELAAARRLQTFFRSTSWRMWRSSVKSATTRFNRAFSSSSMRSLRNSVTPRLANFF